MIYDFNLNNINDTIDQIKAQSESYRNSPAPKGVGHQVLIDNIELLRDSFRESKRFVMKPT